MWEQISVLAYLLAFALLESLFIMILIVGLACLMPGQWLRDGFGYKGFVTVLVATVAAIYIKETMTNQPTIRFFVTIFSLSFMVWIALLLVMHFQRSLQRFILEIADRFLIFLYVFIPLGLLSVLIVMFRWME
jgi:hypothetical protein